MTYCMKCGAPVEDGGMFCGNCSQGYAQNANPGMGQAGSIGGLSEEDFAVFVGKDNHYYLPKFRRFSLANIDDYSFSWHWPAFFVPGWWFLYRKLYLWAFINFLVNFIPVLNFISLFAWPATANYIYYKHAKNKIIMVSAMNRGADIKPMLAQVGGVNPWVWTLAVVVTLAGIAALILYFGFLMTLIGVCR